MRIKSLLAVLMVAGLALAGCSSDDDDNPSPNPTPPTPVPTQTTVTGSTAWLNGSSVMFTGRTGENIQVGSLAQGSLTFPTSLLNSAQAPFAILIDGGKLMNGKATDFRGNLRSISTNGVDNLNANFATTLMHGLYYKLPLAQQTPENLAAVKQKTMQVISVLVGTMYEGATVSEDAVFGAPSPYSEQVLLAAQMVAVGASTAEELLASEAAPNVDALITAVLGDVPFEITSGAFDETLKTFATNTERSFGDKREAAQTALATTLKANVEAMVAVKPDLAAAGKAAVDAAEKGELVPPPADAGLPNLVFAFLNDGTNGSRQITEWHLNNSSANFSVLINGSLTLKGPQVTAAGASFNPEYSGLSITVDPGKASRILYTNSSAETLADGTANIKAVFDATTTSKAGELGLSLKVFQNKSSDAPAWVRFSDNKTMELPLTTDKAYRAE